ncbi:MAG: ABC transporter substrate-binding protein [Lachnospiraceae bacterium]|nr:ABC transporter substrate-binding protein [Lachnospiraceae bacterium]
MKKRLISLLLISAVSVFLFAGCGNSEEEDVIVLRVSNWEEYIDEGDWGEDEVIDLEEISICSDTGVVEDFENWYYETYGKEVVVEYSTFGTNEELYNQITMGDTYDLVCPSEYMIMKMMSENMLEPFSMKFFDESVEENYYVKGVSPYISGVFDDLSIGGEQLSKYAAGYMWGTLGIVYNPEVISEEEASHWDLLLSEDYSKRITIKDSVRDAFFAGISIYNYDIIMDEAFTCSDSYHEDLTTMLNSTDEVSVDAVEEILSRIKDNVYSFETDSGKADMVTGKVVANQQWSGDAVYTLDQADEDGVTLCYAAPDEATNLWFDGWCMLKNGIGTDADKKHAAEAFINFVSMPENAVRNMYYIGYTSVISGGEDDTVFQYADWCYGADEEEAAEAGETLVEYPIDYFFTGSEEETGDYTILTYEEQLTRQLFAQYPTKDVVDRSVVMAYFDKEGNERINRMWTNVRCFDLSSLWR